jgi:hypothetical protein
MGSFVHGNILLQKMRTSLRQGKLIDWFLDHLCATGGGGLFDDRYLEDFLLD